MKIVQLFIFILLTYYAQAWFYQPELTGYKYQSLLAEEKLKKIQHNIYKTTEAPASYPFIKLAELLVQNNDLAFDTVGDDLPVQGIFPVRSKREKLIHPVGMIAQCIFESNGKHDYTGIFKGVDNAFVRFSVANKPDKKSHEFTPGFVFKFLRDGQPSANIFSMYALTGQNDSSNIFQHDMSSHVPMTNADAPIHLKVLANNFLKTSDYPVFLGLSNAAQYDQNGNFEKNMKFPYRLQFHPSQQAKNSMSSHLEITKNFFIDALNRKQIEGTLFDVYAQAEPYSELELIGSIKMTTPFESSEYADQTLYFQHQKFEEDLEIRPDWKQATEDILADQENTFPQYHYPDIQ